MIKRITAWWKERKRIAERKRQIKCCAQGKHKFYALNEQHSIMSMFCELSNMPGRCEGCGLIAYTDWIPGKGIVRWEKVPDSDLTELGIKEQSRG